MLNWSKQFNIFCFLDSNGYSDPYSSFEYKLAAGCEQSISLDGNESLKKLQDFYRSQGADLFGHFGYGLKQETLGIRNEQEATIDFGLGFFFRPSVIITSRDGVIEIESTHKDPADIFAEIFIESSYIFQEIPTRIDDIRPGLNRNQYVEVIAALKDHIHRGDCYEINFCQEFAATNAQADPFFIYKKLTEASPNPFSALYRINSRYCICASPERYLKKSGSEVISQPIKGTSKRFLSDPLADKASRHYLETSPKERAENVMIVDLVRNDLSRVCEEGSVEVKELYGIYSFPQVYQMISTIRGVLPTGLPWTEIIKASFPMGSMTGAPKNKVVELIDRYEVQGRGLFSGAIGYIKADGDFDFNVVIRSIFYDQQDSRLSFLAGSGITYSSNAEDEYEECLLKAAAINKVLKD
jgi:para-aminobenzoate synthetase component I